MRLVVSLSALVTGLGLVMAVPANAKPDVGTPATVQANPLALAVTAADKAASSGLDALKKHSPFEQFDRRAVYRGGSPSRGDLFYVSYNRTYRGLQVVGGDAVVATDSQGKVLSTASAVNTAFNVDTHASVSADAAKATSLAQFVKVDGSTAPQLVVLAEGQATPILAWDTVVSGRSADKASRKHVYVNAQDGKVALSREEIFAGTGTGVWEGNVSIPTSGSSGNYQMKDPTRGNISCANYSNGSTGAIFTDADDVWGSTSKTDKVAGCVDVLYTNAKEWDMVSSWLGRNGLNGNGGSWPSYVGLTERNAYWNYVPNATLFGYNSASQWLTAIDVVAHENGHGIDQNTPGGTASEAGLGEATGDIFGALTEFYANNPNDPPDYQVGEMVNFSGNGNPLRYMYQPSLDGRSPNCYSSSIPNTEVHDAAGPLNHWFYLLAEGTAPGNGKPTSPTCNSTSLTGVGIQDAGRVFYNAMLLKTSSMTHKKYRIATLQAAKNLDSTCNLYNKTKAAWDAISLPAQSGEATCSPSGSDWSMSLSPTSGSVQPGQSITSTVTLTASGTAQTVSLSASGAPSGVTVSFNPTSVSSNGGTSTMTIAASSGAAGGSSTITVAGDGTTDHSASFNLTVGSTNPGGNAPDISVDNVKAHLNQLQTIANNNGGNRATGTGGHTASAAYVKSKLEAAGFTVTMQTCTTCNGSAQNVIADWPGGDTSNTYMFGAHLDSVSAGPGINDDGSGSAALLEVALALAAQNPTMTNHARFAWWAGEEQGLIGSKFYVNGLSATAKSQIKVYATFDMIASTNAGYFVNGTDSTSTALRNYFTSINVQTETSSECCSDDGSFRDAGIAASLSSTGASATKTSAQVTKWGGTAGQAYDSCYHKACDSYPSNINSTSLDRYSDAIASAVWKQTVGGNPPANDFSVSVSPTSGSVNPGSSTTATVGTSTTSGSSQSVSLSAGGQPSGVTVSFNPSSVTSGSSSTMTVAVGSSVTPGTYTITITGTGSATHTTTYSLTVNGTSGGRTFTNNTDFAIQDNRIYSSVNSTATGNAVSPVTVAVTINHTCAEDLGISLISPNGTIYAVKYSGTGNYVCHPFGGLQTYSVPVSSVAAGTWQLRVTDYGPGDYGVLDTWSITL